MTSLSFQTAIQKNKTKLGSFVQFENEIAIYRVLYNRTSTTSYVLTVLKHSHIQINVTVCTALR